MQVKCLPEFREPFYQCIEPEEGIMRTLIYSQSEVWVAQDLRLAS